MLTVLDLFSGIGGFSLGLQWTGGFRTMAFCEKDTFCQKVLAKHWPTIPCYDDIHMLSATRMEEDGIEPVDLVCGGFPCQPFSQAGDKRGTADDRYLWPEMCRVIAECRPRWVVGENVAGIVRLALDTVCTDLEAIGYTVWPLAIPACAVDAPHIRERVWILAHDNHSTKRSNAGNREGIRQAWDNASWSSQTLANASSHRLERRIKPPGKYEQEALRLLLTRCGQHGERENWPPEPTVGRVAHGIPRRVDRLRALGNAVVPQVVEQIGRAILQVEAERQCEQI